MCHGLSVSLHCVIVTYFIFEDRYGFDPKDIKVLRDIDDGKKRLIPTKEVIVSPD